MEKTMTRIKDIERQLVEIDQLGLWDRCEQRVDNLLEEMKTLKEQLND